jgi:hypothetical protein
MNDSSYDRWGHRTDAPIRLDNPRMSGADLAQELADYLNTDIDPYDFQYLLPEWWEASDGDPDIDPDDLDVGTLGEDDLKQFTEWIRTSDDLRRVMQEGATDSPSYLFFRDAKPLGENVWLVHFSNAHFLNFQKGATLDNLALSRHSKVKQDVDCSLNADDEEGMLSRVYGFAYKLSDVVTNRKSFKDAIEWYGERAVVFRTDSAVGAYHVGDDENQAIFTLCTEQDVMPVEFATNGSCRLNTAPNPDDPWGEDDEDADSGSVLSFDSRKALLAYLIERTFLHVLFQLQQRHGPRLFWHQTEADRSGFCKRLSLLRMASRNGSVLRDVPHLAWAAFFAASLRCPLVMPAARAAPPFSPPSLPSIAAALLLLSMDAI